MAAKTDNHNWLKDPENLELVKNIPFLKISDEKKAKRKKIYEFLYNSDLSILRIEY